MTRLLLRAINSPALVLLAMVGIAIQTSLFSFWPLIYLQPDIVLLVVIWCALRRPFVGGGVITLIVSHIAEIHSGAPSGVFLITYMILYLGLRGASRILVIPDLTSMILATLVLSALSKICIGVLLTLLGAGGSQWRHLLFYLIPEAMVNGMMGKWLFRWLDRFDWVTFRSAQAERALESELGELQLEGETG